MSILFKALTYYLWYAKTRLFGMLLKSKKVPMRGYYDALISLHDIGSSQRGVLDNPKLCRSADPYASRAMTS